VVEKKPVKKPVKKSVKDKTIEDAPVDTVEKGFKSKKFAAFMTSTLLWKGLLFWMVYSWAGSLDQQMTILGTVIVSGFVDVGYIVSVAALDKYVRVARITAGRTP
jgi:hypothetical protein